MRRALTFWVPCALACLLPTVAHAQASRVGPTFSLGGTTAPVEQPDVAHDSTNDRYLQVAGKGFIEAHLLNSSGAVIGAFRVNATGEYAQSPRVAFSPHAGGIGGYLVTWHASFDKFARVRGRIFNANGTPLTGDFDIATTAVSAGTSSNWTMGAAIAYATGSQEFLVAWMGNYTTTNDIFFQRVNIAGALLGPNTLVSAGTADWERDPAVAYSPQTDEFLVAYGGYFDAGRYGYTAARRVKAGSGGFTSGELRFGAAVATYVPSVAYSSAAQQYVLAWYNRTSSSAAVYGVTLNLEGTAVSPIRVLSPYYAAYDALDVEYNPPSGQYLLVTHGAGATSWEDAAVSLYDTGAPVDNGFIITNTTDVRPLRSNPSLTDGNFNPRLTTSASAKTWLLVTSSVFAATHAQFAATSASGGGGGGGGGGGTSDPRLFLDTPTNGSTVQPQFALAGWSVDLGASSGTGIMAVHAWAFPASGGGPIFVGAANLGGSRLDVAGYYNRSQFATSGFNLLGSLPPGTYDIRVSGLSSVAGAFNVAAMTRVTVAAPLSKPRMFVDLPAFNQTVTRTFLVAGWAVDLAASSGTGVDGIHVWAYPAAGGSPIFVGAGTLGVPRSDVAAVFGSGQFGTAGYFVWGSLPPGEYNLIVYAHSTVAGDFNQAAVVHIRVV